MTNCNSKKISVASTDINWFASQNYYTRLVAARQQQQQHDENTNPDITTNSH